MNKSLSQLPQQLSTTWEQLGLNQRVSLILAVVVVVAGLIALTFWSSRVDYALLYGKLDDTEAARVITALEEAKVPYQARGRGTIMVPANRVHSARMQLASQGIPRGDGVGFEIFDKPNFGISDFVQRANYLRAVQGELSRTIAQVDHVESARVMVVMPENRLLVDSQRKPTASVFVRVRGTAQLPSHTVNAIRFLVANSVEGLQANSVTVVDNLGNVLSDHSEPDSIAGLTTTQLTARKNLEQYLAKKTEGMLEAVLGPGQAIVRVSAEINFDTSTQMEERFDPDGQVLRTSIIDDENTDTTSLASSRVPSYVDLDADGNEIAPVPVTSNRMRKKTTNNQYEINRTSSTLTQAPGGVKRLSAAVFVAARTEGEGEERVAVPRSEQELERLRRIVQSALGILDNNSSRQDQITLEEMAFSDPPLFELATQMQRQETQQFWFDLARNAAYPLLALMVLVFFWRVFKRTANDTIPLGVPVAEFGENGRRRNGSPPMVTVEILNQLVRENPNNMTQAIRTWMARGKPPQ